MLLVTIRHTACIALDTHSLVIRENGDSASSGDTDKPQTLSCYVIQEYIWCWQNITFPEIIEHNIPLL